MSNPQSERQSYADSCRALQQIGCLVRLRFRAGTIPPSTADITDYTVFNFDDLRTTTSR